MAAVIRKLVTAPKAPKPIAPYNQAVLVDRTLYVSGVIGLNDDSSAVVTGGIKEETRKVLEMLGSILEAGGSSFDKVIKTKIFLKSMDDFKTVNEIYQEFFTKDFPARSAIQVAALPMNALVEIEAVALTGEVKTIAATAGCTKCGPATCPCKM